MPASIKNGVYVFNGVPLNTDVSIIAINCKKDSYEVALKQTTITNEGISNLKFEVVTLSELKEKLEILNSIN